MDGHLLGRLLIPGLAAIGAFASALAAFFATSRASRAAQAQLVLFFRNQYASQEMLTAMKIVTRWNGEPIDTDDTFDRARRTVAHHFLNIALLTRGHLLSRKSARVAALRDEVAFYVKRVQPMDAAAHNDYDDWAYQLLASLYRASAALPPRTGEAELPN